MNDKEPNFYQKTMQVFDSDKWITVMKEELDALQRNKTWNLVELP